MRRLLPLLLGLAGLGSLFAAASGAQTGTKPEPGCAGVAATDKSGDQISDPIGLGVGSEGPANLDITRFWFDRTAGRTTVNIEVKNLTKANSSNATSISWYVTWTTNAEHFVDATSDGSAVTYQYGDYDSSSGLYSPAGNTSGQFAEGANGVITITIPSAIGGTVGTTIKQPYVAATENYDTPAIGLLSTDDRAPDSSTAYGRSWTVTDCDGTGATPTPTETPTGTPTATPTPGGGGQVVQPGKLKVNVAGAPRATAKQVAVKLSGTATKIKAALYQGTLAKPKVYGTGTLAKVAGKATLKIKLQRKIKKGSYALTLVGTNPDGTRASKSFKVKFKK